MIFIDGLLMVRGGPIGIIMCDKTTLWAATTRGLRFAVGTMFLVFGVYDLIWPDAATSRTTVDLRYVGEQIEIRNA